MAQPGWYPDPSGRPAHFRYWDGSRWSAETTTNPSDPAPAEASSTGDRSDAEESGGRSVPKLAGLVAVVLVLVLVVVLLVRNLTGDTDSTAVPPPPPSTVSAWDETSEPDPSPTPPPQESPEPPPEEVSCPTGSPGTSSSQPDPSRVSSAKISFAAVDDYGPPAPKYGLSWFHDTMSQSQTTEPGWESFFAVGDIVVEEFFDTPGNAATASMQCMINDNFFSGFTDRTDLVNEAIEVDGRPGWMVAAEIRVDNPGLSVEGDVVTLIFVDDGRDDRLSGFVSTVPIDDTARIALSDEVVKSLRIGN